MSVEETIKLYLDCLERADLDKMLSLFSEGAIVNSPLRGEVNAPEFYRDLFADTQSSKITLLNIFKSDNPAIGAGHFRYDWVLKDDTPKPFECVDVFRLDSEGKIKHLMIIYDTYNLRAAYEKVRQK